MHLASQLNSEGGRYQISGQTQVSDVISESALNDLIQLAATICNAPLAWLSLFDIQRLWSKATGSIALSEFLSDSELCCHTVLQQDILIVPDTLEDERFANTPSVKGTLAIRFYAGVPLIASDGSILGCLCVADRQPRDLSPQEIESLTLLARQVVGQVALHQQVVDLQRNLYDSRHQEAALRESEVRFRTIADSSPILIWMDDVEQRVTFLNQTGLQFMGKTLDCLAQEGWLQGVHPDDRQRWSDHYTAAFKVQAPYTVEYRLQQANGDYHWMLETGVPRLLSDGLFAGYIGSCIDITDRKAAEHGNQLLRTMTQAIVTSPDLHSALQVALQKVCEATQWEVGEAWVPDPNQAVMVCSPAWYGNGNNLIDFRQQSECVTFPMDVGIPGRVWRSKQTEWYHDVSTETAMAYVRAKAALKAGLRAALGVPLMANDEVIAVLVFYMFEAHSEDQRLIDVIAASTELGLFIQRKHAEEEVRKCLEKEQRLNHFKSRFIANVSHELRTPLTSILGLSHVLLKQHFGALNAEQEQYLSMIHRSGDHLLKLINDLLDLAKIEAGKQELHKTIVDVADLCNEALKMIEVRAMAKHQSLSLQLPVSVTSIVVDRQRIIQILLNYLANAVKFTPEGGAIILKSRLASTADLLTDTLAPDDAESLDTTDPLAPSPSSNPGFLVLEVQDTGKGIPLARQHLLFQSFQQLDNVAEGSGLGLVVSKQLAELHHGRVSFTSTVGMGSIFSLWLPLER